MRRRLITALSPLVLLGTLACQPGDFRPGAWLSGEEVPTPVTDWAFTDAFQNCYLEAATWYRIPHSVELWCAEHDGGFYIGSMSDSGAWVGERKWEKHLARNGDGAVRVDGKIYRGTLVRVEDAGLTEAIQQRYTAKYGSSEEWKGTLDEKGQPPNWRFYRFSQRG